MRGYYLLDEFAQGGRRRAEDRPPFLVRPRRRHPARTAAAFDAKGEIESDIVYGKEGNLPTPANIRICRSQIRSRVRKEKYSMKLTYQTPEAVTIGKTYPASAFVLQNTWELEEVDLDKRLQEADAAQPGQHHDQTDATRLNRSHQ